MTSQLSVSNNCNRPLTGDPSGNTFTGAFESSAGALVIAVFVASPTTGLVTINQSNNRGVNIQLTDTFNINAEHTDAMNVFRVPCGFSSFQVIFHNNEGTQTYLSLNTYLESFYNSEVNATVTGSVDATITGPLDANGDVKVKATNLITETLATRRVDFLVVGNWYRVASVGLTSGAQWNAIGAIVDGESVPAIGRLFKCLSIGPAVAGGGECYDVEYNTNAVTLTDPTTVRVRDTYGDAITTTAGNLMVGINNIYTANPLHTIVDSGPATQAVTGTFYQATQPVSIASSVAVTGTFYQTTQPVSIAASVPVTGTFYQATQPVSLPSTSAFYHLTVDHNAVTIKNTPGQLISLFIGSDGITGTNYVKIYNTASPTSGNTPVLVIPIDYGRSINVNCVNLDFNTAIGLRATASAANNSTADPTNVINVTAFYV